MNRRVSFALLCLALIPVVFYAVPASAYTLSAILIVMAVYFLWRGRKRRD